MPIGELHAVILRPASRAVRPSLLRWPKNLSCGAPEIPVSFQNDDYGYARQSYRYAPG